MSVRAACPRCDRIHCAGDVVAVGRFERGGPSGYRYCEGGRTYPTRQEAEMALCASRMTAASP